jgi:hypothetical protein
MFLTSRNNGYSLATPDPGLSAGPNWNRRYGNRETLNMTFDELEHCVGEDIILQKDTPAAITAEVSKLLDGLDSQNIFAVRRLAKDIRAAISSELAASDGDMIEVVRILGSVLEPIINWLEFHGVNGRSLRSAKLICVGLGA